MPQDIVTPPPPARPEVSEAAHEDRPRLSMWDVYLRLDGRIGRTAFWVAILPVNVVANFASGSIFRSGNTPGTTAVAALIWAASFWPTVCIAGKRFHDRGKSAWWCLILLIPIAGDIWMVVECGFLAGDAHANRFGRITATTRYG